MIIKKILHAREEVRADSRLMEFYCSCGEGTAKVYRHSVATFR